MTRPSQRKFQKELNSGAISLVLLTTLEQLGRPVYGYELAKVLEARASQTLPMNQAAIYPVLRSLEKQSLLASEMVKSESGPPRKYYRLTADAEQTLAEWKRAWSETTQFVDSILENADGVEARRVSRRTLPSST